MVVLKRLTVNAPSFYDGFVIIREVAAAPAVRGPFKATATGILFPSRVGIYNFTIRVV